MTIEEIDKGSIEQLGKISPAFEVGADWMQEHHPTLKDIREGKALLVDKDWLDRHEANIKKEIIARAWDFIQENFEITSMGNDGKVWYGINGVNKDDLIKAMEE